MHVSSLIGTHDVQNILVSSPQPGEVKVAGDFIDESTATGVLAVFVDLSTSKILYHLIKRGNNKQQLDDTIQGVVGGEHSISFFVVEESGLPFNRTALMPIVVNVENGRNITFLRYMNNTLIGSVQHYIISVDLQVLTVTKPLLSTLSSSPPLVSASHVPSWTVLPLTVWQWYINESLSSALVD